MATTNCAALPSAKATEAGSALLRGRTPARDAEVLARLNEAHGDDVVQAFFLDGEAFRARYAEMAGIDYWA